MIEVRTCLLFILLSVAPPAYGEYRIGPGDVLEVNVGPRPELRQRLAVQPDGFISAPIIGSLPVDGMTRDQVRRKVEEKIARRFLQGAQPDPPENLFVLKPGDVAVNIVEFRPVYVSGDIMNAGQFPYRPGLTLRQLVALAGGMSMLHGRSPQDPKEIQAQYSTQMVEFVRLQVHLARLEAEIAGADDVEFKGPSSELTASMLRSERESLKNNNLNVAREHQFVLQAIRQADEQISALELQEKQELAGLEADTAELSRINKLYGQGSLPSPRVTEARRAVLLSSTRRQQTAVNLIQTKRERDQLQWRIQKNAFDRKAALLADDRETRGALFASRSRLHGLGARLSGGAATMYINGNDVSSAQARIVRRTDGTWRTIAAAIDDEVQAGDVVEIRASAGAYDLLGVTTPTQ